MPPNNCIYCNKSNSFSKEHVFPSGMGGNDTNFILYNSVCTDCNTTVFSPLEATLMRKSPFGLARMQNQPVGRQQGKRTKPPTFDTETCLVIEKNGDASEAYFTTGLRPIILPQIKILDQTIHVTSHDHCSLNIFYTDLEKLLDINVFTISVKYQNTNKTFEISQYIWDGHCYTLESTIERITPPAGIWLNTLTSSDSKCEEWPRIFRDPKGRIILRTAYSSEAAYFLSGVKRSLATLKNQIEKAIEIEPTTSDNNLVYTKMSVDMRKTFRAICKIGVNFICHEYGEEVAREGALNPIKEFILNGTGSFIPHPLKELEEVFSGDERKQHIAMLYPIPHGNSILLAFVLQLYNGTIQTIGLGEFSKSSKIKNTPVIFLINYIDNKIERNEFSEYLRQRKSHSNDALTE